jgi:hypothetical protein
LGSEQIGRPEKERHRQSDCTINQQRRTTMFVEDESSAFEIVPGSHVLAEQEDGSEYINWNDLSPEEQANYEMLHRNIERDLKGDD